MRWHRLALAGTIVADALIYLRTSLDCAIKAQSEKSGDKSMQGLKTFAIVTLTTAGIAACASTDQPGQSATTTPAATAAPEVSVATDPAFFVDWTRQAMDGRWFAANQIEAQNYSEADFEAAKFY